MVTNGQPSNQRPARSSVILLLGDIAQTTARMFVPTLGGLGLGMWADSSWHTKPWLMITGLSIGVIVTSLLIAQQFRSFKENK